MEEQKHYIHREPAMRWEDGIPLGNGFLGAMVYGHTSKEKIQLNEDSLWYGKGQDRINPKAAEHLKEIQQLVLQRKFAEAEDLMFSYMVSAPFNMRNYSTMGELDLAMNQKNPFAMGWFPESDGENYTSDLDMENGILTISHTDQGIFYKREMFISYPDHVLCIRLKSSEPEAMRLDIALNRYPFTDRKVPDDRRPGKFVSAGIWGSTRYDRLTIEEGRRILLEAHEAETTFAMGAEVYTDGKLENAGSRLIALDAQEVVIYLTGVTDNRVENCPETVREILKKAVLQGYDAIRERHRNDFSAYMKRCGLSLEEDPEASRYFTYGRYLIVSAGREHSSPMNLQGIWNYQFEPSWDSKYTININEQMNYWPVEVCNLSELHEPVFEQLKKMQKTGEEAARKMYGCRGMMAHHNTDYYGDCGTQDMYSAATFWQCGGAWLGLHIWEHYRYTLDVQFLKEYYPVLDDLALFFVDFLIEDPEGYLVTCPSVSPENRFITEEGYDTPICAGPTMDNQIIRALMRAVLEGAEILQEKNPHEAEYRKILKSLRPNGIDSQGRIMEWAKEEKELTPDMGHVSHLWAAFPGDEINWKDTPEYLAAARKSVEVRRASGCNTIGWPGAWQISLFARFLDGKMAGEVIHHMLYEGLGKSWLNVDPVFQIDGNLGLLSGMAECLLQSHLGIHFLPALPPEWKNGTVRGLKARGGAEISETWKDGKLKQAIVKPMHDGVQKFIGKAPLKAETEEKEVFWEVLEDGYEIRMEKGKIYQLIF